VDEEGPLIVNHAHPEIKVSPRNRGGPGVEMKPARTPVPASALRTGRRTVGASLRRWLRHCERIAEWPRTKCEAGEMGEKGPRRNDSLIQMD
jgi:hypothetical protein